MKKRETYSQLYFFDVTHLVFRFSCVFFRQFSLVYRRLTYPADTVRKKRAKKGRRRRRPAIEFRFFSFHFLKHF